jgi:hypothetical protein
MATARQEIRASVYKAHITSMFTARAARRMGECNHSCRRTNGLLLSTAPASAAMGRLFTSAAVQSYTFAMKRNERTLVWLLRILGVIMLTALGAVVMPYQWMNVIHQQQGWGDLPPVPITGYLTRSISGPS